MREALLIARREYLERIRSKAFRISTVLIPLFFSLIFGAGALSGKLSGAGARHIVVASNDPLLAESERAELVVAANAADEARRKPSSRMTIEVKAPLNEDELAALNAEVESKQIDGYLWLNLKPGTTRLEATYTSGGSADFVGRGRMQDAIGHALVREELVKRGATSEEIQSLLKDVDLKTQQVKNGKAVAADASDGFWGAYVMAFMLYFAVVFYGVNVAHSVVAEKTSRVFEVMLASAKPESLMLGKLLGVGAVGLTQMAIWIVFVLLLSSSSLWMTLGLGGLAAYGVTPLRLIFFVLYFILGFFFYSALSAGLGATVSQESEVQQFSMIIVLPQVIGLVLIVYILSNPGAWPVVLLSLFPPCTPIVMCLRMAAMAVPAWQLALSLLLLLLATYGMVWVASRIYRVGILMYGKRPTLPEMVRWLKYS
jgi:ABC-2 type transport system permease protein